MKGNHWLSRFELLLLFFGVVFLFGCENRDEKLETQRKAVMEIHDEAMAKMDVLYNLENKAREKVMAFKLEMRDDSAAVYEELLFKLAYAQEHMMDWMHYYNLDSAANANPKAEKYLQSQMVAVKKVHQDIFEALEEGKNKIK